MGFFEYAISLGIIQIIFGFILHWIIIVPASLIVVTLKIEEIGNFIVELFEAYLLISLTSIITITALQDISGGWKFYIFPFLGAFVLYSRFASAIYEEQKSARNINSFSYIKLKEVRNIILIFGSPIIYLITLYLNPISRNAFTVWLYDIVLWINSIPVVGFLIKIGGILFMLKTFIYGFIFLIILSNSQEEKTAS